jgi:hypothetical protein
MCIYYIYIHMYIYYTCILFIHIIYCVAVLPTHQSRDFSVIFRFYFYDRLIPSYTSYSIYNFPSLLMLMIATRHFLKAFLFIFTYVCIHICISIYIYKYIHIYIYTNLRQQHYISYNNTRIRDRTSYSLFNFPSLLRLMILKVL